MKLGFIYAGQGSQKVGMGKDFYETYPLFKETFDNAQTILEEANGVDVKKLCFEGPEETLSLTQNTQPCMVSFAVGVTKLLREKGITPEYVCGLSLGEYSALYAASVMDEETALKLVAFRGKVMAEAVQGRAVKMVAVLMMEREVIADCIDKAMEQLKAEGDDSIVQVANYNCPGQIVISGDAKAVDVAMEFLKEAGAKRLIELNVSGPFHTSLMKPAGDALKERFKEVSFGEAKIPVLFNVTGKPMQAGDTVAELLEKQVQSSVYLEDSIHYMKAQGVDTVIEIGPGNAISKFVKKSEKDMTVYSIDSVADFEKVVTELGA